MVLFFDTETTSLNPGQICQLSYIMQEGDLLSARNLFFTVDNMDYSAYLVHGFSIGKLKELSGDKRFSDYIEVIENDFSKADLIVSHNTAFDFSFMRAEFERLGKVFEIKNEFCTMKKFTPVCKLPKKKGEGYKYPKLAELCAHFEISDNKIQEVSKKVFGNAANFHDARFDTTAVFLAFNYAAKQAKECEEIKRYL
ncbi:MAG: 3'-5' exonuclease [Clostridiales bacterium]|nr:3'-5' exonuclease [Clostridiales bacterium]